MESIKNKLKHGTACKISQIYLLLPQQAYFGTRYHDTSINQLFLQFNIYYYNKVVSSNDTIFFFSAQSIFDASETGGLLYLHPITKSVYELDKPCQPQTLSKKYILFDRLYIAIHSLSELQLQHLVCVRPYSTKQHGAASVFHMQAVKQLNCN